MSTLAVSTGYDTQVSWTGCQFDWSSDTVTGSLTPGCYSKKRRDSGPMPEMAVLHDQVTITSIKVEMTASYTGVYANQGEIFCYFCGALMLDKVLATGTSTNYSETITTGLPTPATIRASDCESWVQNIDTFYTKQFNCSLPIITIEYIDNGFPQMLQFSL
jgi:hypothetical protein